MGHKVHPYGFRLGVSRTWSAKWYADKDYRVLLLEDIAIRRLVEKRLANASVSQVEIERGINHVTVTVHTAKPAKLVPSLPKTHCDPRESRSAQRRRFQDLRSLDRDPQNIGLKLH